MAQSADSQSRSHVDNSTNMVESRSVNHDSGQSLTESHLGEEDIEILGIFPKQTLNSFQSGSLSKFISVPQSNCLLSESSSHPNISATMEESSPFNGSIIMEECSPYDSSIIVEESNPINIGEQKNSPELDVTRNNQFEVLDGFKINAFGTYLPKEQFKKNSCLLKSPSMTQINCVNQDEHGHSSDEDNQIETQDISSRLALDTCSQIKESDTRSNGHKTISKSGPIEARLEPDSYIQESRSINQDEHQNLTYFPRDGGNLIEVPNLSPKCSLDLHQLKKLSGNSKKSLKTSMKSRPNVFPDGDLVSWVLPDAPPDDFSLDMDMDMDIEMGSESQAWFFQPDMYHLNQSIVEIGGQSNEGQPEVSCDNEILNQFVVELASQSIESTVQSEFSTEIDSIHQPVIEPEVRSNEVRVQSDLHIDLDHLHQSVFEPEGPVNDAAVLSEIGVDLDQLHQFVLESESRSVEVDMQPEISDLHHLYQSVLESEGQICEAAVQSDMSSDNEAYETLSNYELPYDTEILPLPLTEDCLSEIAHEAPPGVQPEMPVTDTPSDLVLAVQVKKKPPLVLPYRCTECGQCYVVRDHLMQHLYDHIAELTGERPFTCPKCPGRRFPNMKLHERHHRMGLECDVCGQAFHAAIVIAEHRMRVHSAKKNVSCKICHKSFALSSELKRHHKKRHLKSNSYKCKVCGKGFKDKDTLSKHELSHDLEKRAAATKHDSIREQSTVRKLPETQLYKCSQCSENFTSEDQVNDHAKIMHGTHTAIEENNVPSNVTEKITVRSDDLKSHSDYKPYKCDECGASYTSKQALKDHTSARHREERTHKCKECSYSSSSSSRRDKHMRKYHKDKIFECKQCDRWFLKKEDLIPHREKYHKNGQVRDTPKTANLILSIPQEESKP